MSSDSPSKCLRHCLVLCLFDPIRCDEVSEALYVSGYKILRDVACKSIVTGLAGSGCFYRALYLQCIIPVEISPTSIVNNPPSVKNIYSSLHTTQTIHCSETVIL